jgi:hypothetical protein
MGFFFMTDIDGNWHLCGSGDDPFLLLGVSQELSPCIESTVDSIAHKVELDTIVYL